MGACISPPQNDSHLCKALPCRHVEMVLKLSYVLQDLPRELVSIIGVYSEPRVGWSPPEKESISLSDTGQVAYVSSPLSGYLWPPCRNWLISDAPIGGWPSRWRLTLFGSGSATWALGYTDRSFTAIPWIKPATDVTTFQVVERGDSIFWLSYQAEEACPAGTVTKVGYVRIGERQDLWALRFIVCPNYATISNLGLLGISLRHIN